jgi:hypothetical protein
VENRDEDEREVFLEDLYAGGDNEADALAALRADMEARGLTFEQPDMSKWEKKS